MTEITWFKLYHEALDDPKFLGIADRIKSRPGDVFHVFLKLLKRASENDDRGSIAGFDEWGEAAWLRIPVDEVRRIITAIREIRMIIGDQIARWAKRQGAAAAKLAERAAKAITPAATRQRRRRAKIAAASREPEFPGFAAGVTPSKPGVTPSVTPSVTPTAEERRDDSEAVASEYIVSTAPNEFEEFWQRCPRKVAKAAARKAYRKARRVADWHTIISGMLRYAAECDGRDPRFIKHPATWLTGECWNDEPAPITISHNGESDGRRPLSRSEQRAINNRRVIASVFGELMERAA